MTAAVEFLSVLFSHLPPGFIEVRVIEDKKRGQVIERRWCESADALVDAVEGLNRLGEAKNAAIYFGVLPRQSTESGKGDNLLPGLVAWADLDFGKFPGGETEARERLGTFPLVPNAIVRSGHGLHVYWAFREPEAPEALADLSKRLARALGGDHAFDAARVLRLPGTWNRKDPRSPVLVEIERLELDARFNPSDFTPYLLPLEDDLPAAPDGPADSIHIGSEISPRVRDVVAQHPRIRGLFHGNGKLPSDGGRPCDTTSSGYDFSLVLALAKYGIGEELELATVLWFRPDGVARGKGIRYIARTVREALSYMSKSTANRPDDAPIDFKVDRVRVFNSNPPICELTVDGSRIVLTSKELLSVALVRQRLFNVLHRVPQLPKPGSWHAAVNALMDRAEFVEQPPDASPDGLLQEEIARVVDDLAVGESAADLDRDRAVLHEGHIAFKTKTVLKKLREQFPDLSTEALCAHLQSLRFQSGTIRVAGVSVRAWHRRGSNQDGSMP